MSNINFMCKLFLGVLPSSACRIIILGDRFPIFFSCNFGVLSFGGGGDEGVAVWSCDS